MPWRLPKQGARTTSGAYAGDDDRCYGWVMFVGVLLLMLGTLNFIEGLAAVANGLGRHGLSQRLPRRNTYQLTNEGNPGSRSSTPNSRTNFCGPSSTPTNPAKIEIRRALKTLKSAINEYVHNARLAPAP